MEANTTYDEYDGPLTTSLNILACAVLGAFVAALCVYLLVYGFIKWPICKLGKLI